LFLTGLQDLGKININILSGKYCLNQVELLIDWLKSKEASFLTAGQCARKWHEILAIQEI